MMTSIFSSLDLMSMHSNLSNTNLMLVFMLFILSNNLWANHPLSMITNLSKSLMFELSITSKSLMSTMSMNIMYHFFKLLIILNLVGLIPFIPSLTAHMMFSMGIGMVLWFSLILQLLTMKPGKSLSSQIPENSPSMISSFLSLVEGISNIIRPLTLSFRLTANLSASHIILAVLSTVSMYQLTMNFKLMLMLTSIGVLYFSFEIMITLVQAFVLILLYQYILMITLHFPRKLKSMPHMAPNTLTLSTFTYFIFFFTLYLANLILMEN